ncbi:MAG TPA: CAP domain-containing protein [Salinimicrobium sp.]|nr:CAP domain-containing protein [Salinimicrobium sp.]
MKNFTYSLWLLVFCMISLTSCSKESIDEIETADLSSTVAPFAYTTFEVEVLELVNDYRVENGYSELDFMDAVSWQAEDHNAHMVAMNEVCHDDFGDRYAALVATVQAKAVSENVAYGYRTAEAVVNAWIKSEGHRKNLEGNFTHFGISITKNDEGKFYFTNIFVRK